MRKYFCGLEAISPVDGRYRDRVERLRKYFSEESLIRYRIRVELEYWMFFHERILKKRILATRKRRLRGWYKDFDLRDARKVKEWEKITNHDVKAVEYFLREKMRKGHIKGEEWLHFGLTSEDVNNLAFGLALKGAMKKIVVPEIEKLCSSLRRKILRSKRAVMLARTHGQVAVPTTMGKELAVFLLRIQGCLKKLKKVEIEGKLNGAVGNYNALNFVFPKKNWIKYGKEFVTKMRLKPALVTTQILHGDSYIRMFSELSLLNSITIGLCQDLWRYVGDGYFKLKVVEGEVGSSTMPQKVNPIDFENGEGSLGMANSILRYFEEKLPISRLQRDLSDSTVKRNMGLALAYCILGYQSCTRGLEKLSVDRITMKKEVESHWEVITEGVQTLFRREGKSGVYEELLRISRGRHIGKREWEEVSKKLGLSRKMERQLKKLTPLGYVGLAEKLTSKVLRSLK